MAGPIPGPSVNKKFLKYDVFINHRGPDTKIPFVIPLESKLLEAGIAAFVGRHEIQFGEHGVITIDEAIRTTSMHIAIFSKHYAESRYCLSELHQMFLTGRPILTVFYDIEPEHVRRPLNPRGPYAEAFRIHEKRENREDVDRWVRILSAAAEISGFVRADYSSDDDLARKIIEAVSRLVIPRYSQVVGGADSPQDPPRHFYGNQCRVIKEQLLIAQEILNKQTVPNEVSSAQIFWPQLVFTEFRRVVKLGNTLIEACHDDVLCHKAYLRQGGRTEAFTEVLTEIFWCVSVLVYYNSIKKCLPLNPSMDEFPQARLGDEKQYLLRKAMLDDQKELQASLAIWIEGHSCSAKECGRPLIQHRADDPLMCLAAQILERMSNGEGDVISDIEADHTSVMWKTTQEALKDNRQIGKGAFGTVTETTWLGDKYAKKEFDMVPKYFEDEANALAKLNHPHIVEVSAYSVGSHTCFFLMERMDHDLLAYMKTRMRSLRIMNSPFSILAAIDVMVQISEAMSYMNSMGMVHRDLKAQNILVKPVDDPELLKEGFVIAKLADFGLAKSKHEVTSFSHMTRNQGTRRWMAPEMFGANAVDDEQLLVAFPRKADVYSFGILCSEVLTGMLPFHNATFRMGELYSLLTNSDNPLRPELPESCPESLASLIRECWHTDPRRRPAFLEISKTLRYLKGSLMMTDSV